MGYVLVDNTSALLEEIKKDNNKIFISGSFELTARAVISGNHVVIESDKKTTITSRLWFNKFRFFESFTINGKNVTMRGLRLEGDDCNIGMLDHDEYQTAIRCHADSFHIINCDIECFGWCGIYGERYHGMVVEQCYIAHHKNYGYGYGVWFEGGRGNIGLVKDCIFEDNRESVDAGGQTNAWTVTGCVTDRGFTSHRNPFQKAGIGVTITGNYFLNGAAYRFPAPYADTGWVVIKGNYFMVDSVWRITGSNPKAKYDISGNHYNCKRTDFPITRMQTEAQSGNEVSVLLGSTVQHPFYQVYFGDGKKEEGHSTSYRHAFATEGTYYIKARTIDEKGIAGEWEMQKVVVGEQRLLTCALKTSSRFTPGGFYNVQLIVDGQVLKTIDASQIWSWKRVEVPVEKGRHTVAVKLICIKNADHPIMLLIDDFDYKGSIANAGFEEGKGRQVWRQSFSGTPSGSGIDSRDGASGKNCWRFEMRKNKSGIVESGRSAMLYQLVLFR